MKYIIIPVSGLTIVDLADDANNQYKVIPFCWNEEFESKFGINMLGFSEDVHDKLRALEVQHRVVDTGLLKENQGQDPKAIVEAIGKKRGNQEPIIIPENDEVYVVVPTNPSNPDGTFYIYYRGPNNGGFKNILERKYVNIGDIFKEIRAHGQPEDRKAQVLDNTKVAQAVHPVLKLQSSSLSKVKVGLVLSFAALAGFGSGFLFPKVISLPSLFFLSWPMIFALAFVLVAAIGVGISYYVKKNMRSQGQGEAHEIKEESSVQAPEVKRDPVVPLTIIPQPNQAARSPDDAAQVAPKDEKVFPAPEKSRPELIFEMFYSLCEKIGIKNTRVYFNLYHTLTQKLNENNEAFINTVYGTFTVLQKANGDEPNPVLSRARGTRPIFINMCGVIGFNAEEVSDSSSDSHVRLKTSEGYKRYKISPITEEQIPTATVSP